MASPEHQPGEHVAFLGAAIAGFLSLWRSLASTRKRPDPDKEDEFDSAATRGGNKAIIIWRLDNAERAQDQLRRDMESGFDRLERLITEMRRDFWVELEKIRHEMRSNGNS